VNGFLFEYISELINGGNVFTDEEMLFIRGSSEYAKCSDQERIYIEEMLKKYSVPSNPNLITSPENQTPLRRNARL